MPNIRLEITFHGLDYVSDRTSREVMKSTSKLMRRAQIAEIIYLLKRAELPLSQYQSLLDRSVKFLQDAPLLNIKEAHQGSWQIIAGVGAFGIWFLQNTIGESLKEGWKQTRLHQQIKDYVSKFRPEKLREFIQENKDSISDLDEWMLRDVEVKSSKKDVRIVVHLSPSGERHVEKHVFIDDEVLLRIMNRDD